MAQEGLRIPDEGEPTSRILIVGEIPGAVESVKGRPFVGPTGKLLDRLLASAGIVRTNTYITNVVPVYTKQGIDKYLKFGRSKVEIIHEDFYEYKRNLEKKLVDSSANVIVLLGRTALWTVLGETNITDRRGSIFFHPSYPNKKIIPIIHPSAALTQYIYTYYIIHDLIKVKKESVNSIVSAPSRDLIIFPSSTKVLSYLDECANHEYLAFDIETTRTKTIGKFQDWEISCVSISYSSESSICIPFMEKGRADYFGEKSELHIWQKLKLLLTSPDHKKILQNGMFDANFLLRKYNILIHPMDDTMIAQGILTPDFNKSLGFLCSIHTDEPYYKDDSKQHTRFDATELFWKYSARDSAVLHDILPKQLTDLKEQNNMKVYRAACELMYPLLAMQQRGMNINHHSLNNAKRAVKSQISGAQRELNLAVQDEVGTLPEELNSNSPKQLKAYFYGLLQIKPKIKDNSITVDEDALKSIITTDGKGVRVARAILALRRFRKLSGTYLEIVLDSHKDDPKDRDGIPIPRMRSSYNPVGTVTGRLSSSKTIFGTGGNMQNQPDDFKMFVIPDIGYVMYNLDYSQAENRIVAYLGPVPQMIDAFENGRDVHSLTASLIFGIPYDEVKALHDSKQVCSIGSGTRSYRHWGKTCNHALNYGMKEQRFAKTCEIPVYEAKKLLLKYLAAYPGVKQFQSYIESSLGDNRTIENLLGRKRKFFGRWDTRLFEAAYAQIPQSTVADLINQYALIPIFFDSYFSDIELLNQVHDSIVIQLPISIGLEKHAEILGTLQSRMQKVIKHDKVKEFFIPVDVEMCKTAAEKESLDITFNVSSSTASVKEAYAKLY